MTELDDWTPRIGEGAAKVLRASRRNLRWGLLLFLGFPAAAVITWIEVIAVAVPGFLNQLGVASAFVVAVLLACVGIAILSLSRDNRYRAIESAYLHLTPKYTPVSAFAIRSALKSPKEFDRWLGTLLPNRDGVPKSLMWTPTIVRPILPGLTERAIRLIGLAPFELGMATWVYMASLGATHHLPGPQAWAVGWTCGLTLAVAGLVIFVVGLAKGRAEFRSGYTTVLSSSRPYDNRIALDLVDWKTGYLLRHAGMHSLSTAVFRERLKAIRSENRRAVPTRITATPSNNGS
jgi:hypothetical protein